MISQMLCSSSIGREADAADQNIATFNVDTASSSAIFLEEFLHPPQHVGRLAIPNPNACATTAAPMITRRRKSRGRWRSRTAAGGQCPRGRRSPSPGMPMRTGMPNACCATSTAPASAAPPPVSTAPAPSLPLSPAFSISRATMPRISSRRCSMMWAMSSRATCRFAPGPGPAVRRFRADPPAGRTRRRGAPSPSRPRCT